MNTSMELTAEQWEAVNKLVIILYGIPPNKRQFVLAMVTAYIAGMEAQEELSQTWPAALKREFGRK